MTPPVDHLEIKFTMSLVGTCWPRKYVQNGVHPSVGPPDLLVSAVKVCARNTDPGCVVGVWLSRSHVYLFTRHLFEGGASLIAAQSVVCQKNLGTPRSGRSEKSGPTRLWRSYTMTRCEATKVDTPDERPAPAAKPPRALWRLPAPSRAGAADVPSPHRLMRSPRLPGPPLCRPRRARG